MATPASLRIERATFTFLADLEAHNDRDWFLANKDRYLAAQANELNQQMLNRHGQK